MASWWCIKSLAFCLAIGVVLCFYAGLAHAAEQPVQKSQLALGVSPAITELVFDPGQPKKFVVTITNVTNAALPVKASAASFQLQEEVSTKDRAVFDASKWIQFAEPEFILYPQQRKQIGITVTPSARAEPGGHYATIFFQPLVAAEITKNNAAFIGSKVGVLALFTIKGTIQQKAAVSLDTTLFNQHGPVNLQLHIKNTGNVHFIPTGSIEIRNMWGAHVGTVRLPPTLVLPKTTKTMPLTWNNQQQIGYFSAQAVVTYGSQQTVVMSAAAGFWILPLLLLALLLIIVAAAGFIFWRTRGRWRLALGALFGKKTR